MNTAVHLNSTAFFFAALLPMAALIVLQVFLSRAKSRIPGLILPIFSFLLSLLLCAGIVVYSYEPGMRTYSEVISEDESAEAVEPDAPFPENAIGGADAMTEIFIEENANGASVGIIGGADGPTAIFVSSPGSVWASCIPAFLLSNIPTVLYAGIYIACRSGKKRSENDKSRIHDL